MAEGPSTSAGASGGNTTADDSSCTDFVDKHQLELIKRVTNVEPILDELLHQYAIQQESYDEIKALPTSEEKMKVLLTGPLDSSGVRGKEILYKILTTTDTHLMEHLRMKNVQADLVMAKEILLGTLNELSSEELQEFMSQIHKDKSFPLAPEKRTELKNTQDFVELMEKTYGQECVEMSRKVLQMMKREDLAMYLLDASSRDKGKSQPSLSQRVEMMVPVTELLLETLACLSDKEFQKFRRVLIQICPKRRGSDTMLLWIADKWYIVFVMVRTYSQKSLEMFMSALLKINRSDLVERLSQSSSGYKKTHSVGEHQSTLIRKVVTMVVVEELLLETLSALSYRQRKNFKWFLQFWFFQRNLPNVLMEHPHVEDRADLLINRMVERCGQNCVEAAMEVFNAMQRFDLVHRLSKTSPTPKDRVKSGPSLTKAFKRGPKEPNAKHVEKMVFDTQLLLETLKKLSCKQFTEFKFALLMEEAGGSFYIPLMKHMSDIQDLVFSMVQNYGQHTVEKTKKALWKIKRNDLVHKLTVDCSGSKKKYSEDDDRSTLIWRVATIAAVKQLVVDTLEDLSNRELHLFWWELCENWDLPHFSVMWDPTEKGNIVALMVQILGQKSVEVTEDIITNIIRPGLFGRFGKSRQRLIKKHFLGKKQHKIARDEKQIILANLSGWNPINIMIFKWLLQFTYFEKNLPQIPWSQLQQANSPIFLMDLMEAKHGIVTSVKVAREVIDEMNTNISSALKEKHQPEPLWTEVVMTPLQKHLLEELEELSYDELERFKHVLRYTKIKEGLPRIPGDLMEMTDRVEIVKLIEETYGEQSVEVTSEVLMKMNRSDLVQSLSNLSFGSEGLSRSLELDSCKSIMQDSSDWPKLEPDMKTTKGDEVPTYSLESEAGHFECSVSGLRWTCQEKVAFTYQFCSWDELMERIKMIQYVPAGPLIDIISIDGRLNEVYLPHWIFIADDPKISEMFAVLHICDSGDVVEKVSEVTPSHVKLPEPVFSPRMVLMKMGIPVKINCEVLIYKTNTAFLTLHVYLIPCDPGLQQAMDKRELSRGYDVIQKPPPEKSLKMFDRYVLTADMDGAEIYPEALKLRYEHRQSHFFEVYLENPDANFKLKLTQQNDSQPVWTCAIRRDEYKGACRTEVEHFVDKHQRDLIARVSNIGPVLDDLSAEGVIQQEDYDTIMALSTKQEKIRKLYSGPLKASGQAGKEIFYKILQKHEPYLVADLQKKKLKFGLS